RDTGGLEREPEASGVMMLPIPTGGILREVRGREEALAVAGIRDLQITIPLGQRVVPLPEGHRYLGFLFAGGKTPGEVEWSLRLAHACLRFVIDAEGRRRAGARRPTSRAGSRGSSRRRGRSRPGSR
ncbi:MAG: hypothetical protein HY509_04240, partial [Acidobacteria bacterium]|nr:hypothetical protein [Acidobacteriota bacterium]